MTERWIVVQTHPRREQWAAENIVRQGYEFYLPKIQILEQRGRLKVAKVEPLFHRHLFARSDHGQWRSLLGCFGVNGIIMSGTGPGYMPVLEITRLKSAEDADGIICLPEYKKAPKFAEGQAVRVSSGPMSGYSGIYQGLQAKDRVKVLLDYMGRKTSMLIADGLLEAV